MHAFAIVVVVFVVGILFDEILLGTYAGTHLPMRLPWLTTMLYRSLALVLGQEGLKPQLSRHA